ncbi:MAG: carboxypeptidase-like regulatory domain-containing protein [Terriglobales bacterium]
MTNDSRSEQHSALNCAAGASPVTPGRFGTFRVSAAVCIVVLITGLVPARAQSTAPRASSPAGESPVPPPAKAATAAVHGHVSDASGKPAADAVVFLQHAAEVPGTDGTPTQATITHRVRTNGKGEYSFSNLAEGVYTLRAERTNNERSARMQVELGQSETKTVDLAFAPAQSP